MIQQNRPVVAEAPAKVNLFLKVTGKRSNGYHELISLMSRIDLCDRLFFKFIGQGIRVRCAHPAVPEDKHNLAHRAARLFLERYRRHLAVATIPDSAGVLIAIDKRIPVAAGLGGGSSNAATVLRVLNRRFGDPFSLETLLSMGTSLGADVPFFVFQQTAVVTGIGERLAPYAHLPPLVLLLACPDLAVSTAWVYKNLKFELTKRDNNLNNWRFRDAKFDVRQHLHNDLERVSLSAFPVIGSIKQALLEQAALGALMSGSGPTVFGVFSSVERAEIARVRLMQNTDWKCFVVRTLS